uniref:Uncharacterized protein n=1 Tax=Oryza barthii TaxID=65489 RepID=A0A0D3GQ53_9ORYZ
MMTLWKQLDRLRVKRKVAQTRKTEAMQGPKKKVASKHKLTKEVQAVKKRDHFSMTTRCHPDDILEKFRMNGLRSRKLIEYLMDCLDPDSICIDLVVGT